MIEAAILLGLGLEVGRPVPAVIQGVPIVVAEPTFIALGGGEFEVFLPDGTMRLCRWSEAKR